MSASLVGSEMCIRDRFGGAGFAAAAVRARGRQGRVGFRPAGGLERAAPARPLSPILDLNN
eukprot:1892798-Alexandrium_andersonii.AAC.1